MTTIANGEVFSSIRAKLKTLFLGTTGEAASTDVPASVDYLRIGVETYARDASGTDLTTGDGATWTRQVLPLASGGTGLSSFPAIRNAIGGYDTRAEAEAANVPAGIDRITVGGLAYVSDASGTALTTGDGGKWSPDLAAHGNTVFVEHFGDNATPGTTDMAAAISLLIAWVDTKPESPLIRIATLAECATSETVTFEDVNGFHLDGATFKAIGTWNDEPLLSITYTAATGSLYWTMVSNTSLNCERKSAGLFLEKIFHGKFYDNTIRGFAPGTYGIRAPTLNTDTRFQNNWIQELGYSEIVSQNITPTAIGVDLDSHDLVFDQNTVNYCGTPVRLRSGFGIVVRGCHIYNGILPFPQNMLVDVETSGDQGKLVIEDNYFDNARLDIRNPMTSKGCIKGNMFGNSDVAVNPSDNKYHVRFIATEADTTLEDWVFEGNYHSGGVVAQYQCTTEGIGTWSESSAPESLGCAWLSNSNADNIPLKIEMPDGNVYNLPYISWSSRNAWKTDGIITQGLELQDFVNDFALISSLRSIRYSADYDNNSDATGSRHEWYCDGSSVGTLTNAGAFTVTGALRGSNLTPDVLTMSPSVEDYATIRSTRSIRFWADYEVDTGPAGSLFEWYTNGYEAASLDESGNFTVIGDISADNFNASGASFAPINAVEDLAVISSTRGIRFSADANNNSGPEASGFEWYADGAEIAALTQPGNLNLTGVLLIDGAQVVSSRQSAIADDASGSGNQATVNAILAALRAHGLIAT